MPETNTGTLAIMDSPSVTPEPLGNTQGSFYNIQNLRSTYLLSALHSNSCSLTVHSIDINLKPLFLYKIPKHCVDILISSNILYGVQYVDLNSQNDAVSSTAASSLEEPLLANTEKESLDADTEKLEQVEPGNNTTKSDETSATTTSATSIDQSEMPSNAINAVSVISSAMASLHTTDDDVRIKYILWEYLLIRILILQRFNHQAQLALFRFEQETVLHLYQMAQLRGDNNQVETLTKDEKAKAFEIKDIHTPMDYVQFYETADVNNEFSLRQMEIMQAEFPKINYDPCYVITNKNVYTIQLK